MPGRSFTAASAQYLTYSSGAVVTGYPVSAAILFKPTSYRTVAQCLWGVGVSGSTDNVLRIDVTTAGAIRARARTTGNSDSSTTGLVTTGAWNLIGCQFVSSTERYAVLKNGTDPIEFGPISNTARAVSGMNTTTIGKQPDSGSNLYTDGVIAYVAVWGVSLSNDDFTTLGNFAHPYFVQPQNLLSVWDMRGTSPEIDTVGRREMVITGATVTDGAPVYYPRKRYSPSRGTLSGGGGGGGGGASGKYGLLLGVG